MQTITILKTNKVNNLFLHEELFKYNSEKKYRWLQKLCFWCLKKLHCQYMEEQIQTTQVQLNTKHLLDFVMEQIITIERDHYMTPGIIFVGSNNFKRFCDSRHDDLIMTPIDLKSPSLHGIKLQVVPWMEGILVIPREMLK